MKALRSWWKRRRIRKFKEWLQHNHVLLPPPDPRCRRDSTQAVP